MNFWQFANESPVLVGLSVFIIALALVDITANIAKAFRSGGEK